MENQNPFTFIYNKLEQLEKHILDLTPNYTPDPPEADIADTSEAAKILSIAKASVYNMVWKNQLPHSKKGKKLYFSKKELLNWIKEGKVKTKAEMAEEVNQKLSNLKKGVENG